MNSWVEINHTESKQMNALSNRATERRQHRVQGAGGAAVCPSVHLSVCLPGRVGRGYEEVAELLPVIAQRRLLCLIRATRGRMKSKKENCAYCL